MIIYLIDNTIGAGFNRVGVIDDFVSVIWTERFIEAGEVEIILPAVHQHLKLLAPGNVLGCEGSQELMLLETRSIEAGMVKATGKTIEAYFNERFISSSTPANSSGIVMVGKGGDILKGIVNYMQLYNIDGSSSGHWGSDPKYNVNGRISDLRVASPDSSETGSTRTETVPFGPVYDTLVTLCKKYKIGQTVVWSKDLYGPDHELVYTTHQGQDLTDSIRFSPDLDNLANAKQLLSDAEAKNEVFVIPPKWIVSTDTAQINLYPYTGAPNIPWFWRIWNTPDPVIEPQTAFQRRLIQIDCTDLTKDKMKGANDTEKVQDLINRVADRQNKVLRDHKRTKIVDGEVTPETQYVYKRDYDLGDLVEVQGDFGDPINGTITEYIRSQDETGERHYPAVSTDPDAVSGTTTEFQTNY